MTIDGREIPCRWIISGQTPNRRRMEMLFGFEGKPVVVTSIYDGSTSDITAVSHAGAKTTLTTTPGRVCGLAASKKLATREGFGFVGFRTPQAAAAAQKHFARSFIDTSRITIEASKPLGDESLARPWSRYSQGSSAWAKKNPEAAKAAAIKAGAIPPLVPLLSGGPESKAAERAARVLDRLVSGTHITVAVLEEVARTETDCSHWDDLQEVLRDYALARLQMAEEGADALWAAQEAATFGRYAPGVLPPSIGLVHVYFLTAASLEAPD